MAVSVYVPTDIGRFIYLFLVLLGVFIAAPGFSLIAVSGGCSLVVVHRLLTTVAFFVVEHGLSSCDSQTLEHRLHGCGTWALLLCGMWDLPGSGIKLVFPTFQGRFLTTGPPEKPTVSSF